ncbi:amidohydrolase family protein [Yinghuangia aomiensis]
MKFVLGDDYGAIGFAHGMYGREFRLYTEHAGVSPLEVIGWATVNGAQLARRGHDLGSVEVGKLADLVVLDRDPSVDVSVLVEGTPRAVLKGGEVVHGQLGD